MRTRTASFAAERNCVDTFTDLRARILALEFPPGCVLSSVTLQTEYAVSSTPVRDAFLRLQEEGLVKVHPQSRTVVTCINMGLARDAHFLRTSVEAKLVRHLAARPRDGLVAKLRHVIELQRLAWIDGDFASFTALDLAFHRSLFDAAGRGRLFEVIQRESVHVDRLRALHLPMKGKGDRILREHQDIVDAIEFGPPEEAKAAMEFHLSQSIRIASELSRTQPEYFRE